MSRVSERIIRKLQALTFALPTHPPRPYHIASITLLYPTISPLIHTELQIGAEYDAFLDANSGASIAMIDVWS